MFFTTGIDTGFANDVLPLALSGISRNIDTIRLTEMFNYATYPDHGARLRNPRIRNASGIR